MSGFDGPHSQRLYSALTLIALAGFVGLRMCLAAEFLLDTPLHHACWQLLGLLSHPRCCDSR